MRFTDRHHAHADARDARDDDVVFALDDVSYRYLDRFPALDRVSLSVRRGERLALLGANGCGKSTLLKLLDGLLFAETGTLRAFGNQVTEESLDDEQFHEAFRSRVGFVFQNSDAQMFSPTVREEIAFGPLHMGMAPADIERRVDDTLNMLGLADLADRAPYQLSGGQTKRVAIASVLVMNPDVLLFDEPTAALDPRTQDWLVDLIEQLGAAGKTIVLATHDLDTLERIADRCCVFDEAHRIVVEGTPAAVLRDRALLRDVNLIHDHAHRHGTVVHAHEHGIEHHEHEHDQQVARDEHHRAPEADARNGEGRDELSLTRHPR